jgi:hypothetical protein
MTTTKTAAKRPSSARRHTRTTEAKADDELDRGIAFTDDDGTRIQVRVRDVKGTHDAALVAATGYDFFGLMEAATQRTGLDLLAALIWFGRMVNGRGDKTYAETLEELDYASLADRDFDEPDKADDGPEA